MELIVNSRKYKPGYQKSWETSTHCKDWIQEVPDQPDRAFCKFCNILLFAHLHSVLKHTCTLKHVNNAKKYATSKDSISKSRSEPELSHAENVDPTTTTFEVVNSRTVILYPNENNVIGNNNDYNQMLELENANDSVEPVEGQSVFIFEPTEEFSCEISEPSEMTTKTISTHILDTSEGKAAGNVPVILFKYVQKNWVQVATSATDADGRCMQLISAEEFTTGSYKLHFDVNTYFQKLGRKSFYPFVEVAINCEQGQHYHIPLLLNPFGYSTYRGT